MFASNTTQVSEDVNYIESVFQSYLYTGNGSTQTITNGIDLSTYGGLVWLKARDNPFNNELSDTARGSGKYLISNSTASQYTSSTHLNAFTSSGFTVGSDAGINASTGLMASWTFRKQPKFFDVVTYTGDGTSNRQIAHSLGSVPGAMIVKTVSTTGYWWVYHRSLSNTEYLELNGTYAKATSANMWASTTPTDTYFTVSAGTNLNNTSGTTYVAYLFAHDAGGFGLTGTDNVISCGSFTTDGSGAATVNLGYEPQWLMFKSSAGSTTNWTMLDSMRGWTNNSAGFDPDLSANLSAAEADAGSGNDLGHPTATGFTITNQSVGVTYIYIAIRRGPMKTPTSGTSVFSPGIATGNGSSNTFTTNFPVDLSIDKARGNVGGNPWWIDRLRGGTQYLSSASTNAESTYGSNLIQFDSNTTLVNKNYGATTDSYVDWMFRRAPSFFDEVCYTGVGGQTLNHNLGVTPELIISKRRSGAYDWTVYSSARGTSNTLFLNLANAETAYTSVSAATSTTFTVQGVADASGETLVAYLFASCPNVSKVGSYTGTGSTQTINCGFTGGARFVMIKRTDSTGDWYVWDTARGIVSANDPRLSLNSTAAEVTTDDSIDPDNSGFIVNQVSATNINVSSATYIYLAIA